MVLTRLARASRLALAVGTCVAVPAASAEAQGPPTAGQGSWIGIRVDVTPETIEAGPLRMAVIEVYRGGPAAIAGIRPGDTLAPPGPLARYEEWTRAIAAASPGDTIRLRLFRNGWNRTVFVLAGRRPPDVLAVPVDRYQSTRTRIFKIADSLLAGAMRMEAVFARTDSAFRFLAATDSAVRIRPDLLPQFMATAWPGATVVSRTKPGATFTVRMPMMAGADLRSLTIALSGSFGVDEGVLATRVAPGSPSAQAGLRGGDVVVSVDGEPVRTVGELLAALSRASAPIQMGVVRHRKPLSLSVPPA